MKINNRITRQIAQWLAILMAGVSMNANAGVFGFGGTSWQEEALQHDGSMIVVSRSVERGGRHEIGQEPPYKEQSLSFTSPVTGKTIKWNDHYSEDIGTASFLPMSLGVVQGIPYLLASPMGCLSYNKWGRPNPPYVVFKYVDDQWTRISLQELPPEIKMPNLIISEPDTKVKKLGKKLVTVDEIKKANTGFRQPEFRSILREPLTKERINQMCDELILYKGHWILQNDPVGRSAVDLMTDSKSK